MDRFSVLNPSVHFSHFSLSPQDCLRLADISTPGDLDVPQASYDNRNRRTSVYPTDFIAELYRESAIPTVRQLQLVEKNQATKFNPGLRFYLAFSALASLSLVVALDGTSISVALPVIAEQLHGSAIEAFWSGTSFLLSSTVFQPVYASFSSVFGRKHLTLLAVTLFLTGTIVAGVSSNMALMLIGRTVQGAGGGGIIALTNILLTDLVPLRHRGNWVGILGAMWAIGSVTGPVVGGSFARRNVWRFIFYLNIPFITISFLLVAFFIRLRSLPSSFSEKLKRTDWIGSIMFVGSMTSLLIPLSWAGSQYSWGSWHVTAPLGFGVIGLILTCFYEQRYPEEPVLRMVVFANRTTNIAYLTTALHGMALWVLLYYQPLYFEGVRGYTPVIAGIALFPATFTVAPLAIVTGLAISKMGKYRWAVWSGWGMAMVGIAFLCAIDVDTQLTQVLLTDLIVGVGLGALFPALQTQLQAASDPKALAFAVSMFSFFRGLGQTLGIAIGGNVFQNQLASKLSKYPAFADRADELARDATSLVEYMKNGPPSEARHILRTAYTESLRSVYIMTAVIAFIAFVASMWIKHYDLDQALETEQSLDIGDFDDMEQEPEKRYISHGKTMKTSTLHRKASVRG